MKCQHTKTWLFTPGFLLFSTKFGMKVQLCIPQVCVGLKSGYFLSEQKKAQKIYFFGHKYPWLPTFRDKIWHEGLTLYGACPVLLENLNTSSLGKKKVQKFYFFMHKYPWLLTFWDEIWHEGPTLYGACLVLLENLNTFSLSKQEKNDVF